MGASHHDCGQVHAHESSAVPEGAHSWIAVQLSSVLNLQLFFIPLCNNFPILALIKMIPLLRCFDSEGCMSADQMAPRELPRLGGLRRRKQEGLSKADEEFEKLKRW